MANEMFDSGMYSDKRMKRWSSHKERKHKQQDSKSKALKNKTHAGFDGKKRWGNSGIAGVGVNSPAMMEARAKFNKK